MTANDIKTATTQGFGSGKTERFIAHTIVYLSGVIVPEALGQRSDFGGLFTPLMGNNPKQVGVHAHDNGVWSEFVSKGKKPFNLDRFLAHLDKWTDRQDQALFATAPDVVGDWQATIRRSTPILPLIRQRGYKAALVAQNGLEDHLDEVPWDELDAIFLGGGPAPEYLTKDNRVRVKLDDGSYAWMGEWKLSEGARRVVAEAKARGKWVHMGRVNSLKRLRLAQSWGVDSADGTYLGFGTKEDKPRLIATVQGWLDELNPAPAPATVAPIEPVAPIGQAHEPRLVARMGPAARRLRAQAIARGWRPPTFAQAA